MIKSERFFLRELKKKDASIDYLSWLQDKEVSRFITHTKDDLSALKCYIVSKKKSVSCLLFGIFCQAGNEHIGNIKYEPIMNDYAVMGILIGEKNWQGKGVAIEVIEASCRFLQKKMNIERVYLGVDKNNLAAINVYTKLGFKNDENNFLDINTDSGLSMVWNLT